MGATPLPLYRVLTDADATERRCRRLEAAVRMVLARAVAIPTEERDRRVGWHAVLSDAEMELIRDAMAHADTLEKLP
jgi:hypothetical protein